MDVLKQNIVRIEEMLWEEEEEKILLSSTFKGTVVEWWGGGGHVINYTLKHFTDWIHDSDGGKVSPW